VTAALPDTAVITRARHPFQGRELRVLGGMRRHGRLELLLVLPDGSKSLIPAAWTGLGHDGATAGDEDGQVLAAAATLGALADLLGACVLVSALAARGAEDRGQAARKPPAKEDNRAACAAQSAAGPGSGATCEPDRSASRRRRRGSADAAGRVDRPGSGPGRDNGARGRGGDRR
jgi:hypothetical protein